jgi:acetolactate synthase-1/2/3 large subunit
MNGALALLRTAEGAGANICFANPGTTELPLVAALDRVPGIRPVLCLFEGGCSGSADGWARMTGRPALTLLHLGPGLANAAANLHNARRARSPILNVIGDHATRHLPHDPLLASDIERIAASVSDTVLRCSSGARVADTTARALEAALAPPGRPVALIVADDVQSEPCSAASTPPRTRPPARVPPETVERAARTLRAGRGAILVGRGGALGRGLEAAGRIAAATKARLFSETFAARLERGRSRPVAERFPYFPEQAQSALAGIRTLVLAGAREPVAFFGYPGRPSVLVPEGGSLRLAGPDEDVARALEDLADALDARQRATTDASPPEPTRGPLDPVRLGLVLAYHQPENAIIVDEGLSSAGPWFGASSGAPPHDVLALTGGAIGAGLPLATGAALACPDRRVIALQADGSGLYTLQSLWTQAREGTHVVTIVCANRSYRILQVELARAGHAEPGPAARAFTDLAGPAPDWVALARGFGVPATRVETSEELARALENAFREKGPHLVEALL